MTGGPPEVEVTIEIPRGNFLKRGSTRQLNFISPLPCPFNYGSVDKYIGLEGDLLDAVVLLAVCRPSLSRLQAAFCWVILDDRNPKQSIRIFLILITS